MARLSNRSIAEQTAMFVGVGITTIALMPIVPKAIFAAGLSTVCIGLTYCSFSSLREIPQEQRRPYVVVGAFVDTALIAMVCYIVWDYTTSLPLFIAVLASSCVIYSGAYWIASGCLKRRRPDSPTATEQ